MSTNNQPSQTLFRFVNLRSPQLSDEKGQDKRFVLAPDELKSDSHFYIPITTGSGSKQSLLRQYASNFKNTAYCLDKNNFDNFKASNQQLYDFAMWVARSKDMYVDSELVTKANIVKANPSNTDTTSIVNLWNNLIYQVVTQEDYYIKEVMMQMLLAIHIVKNLSTDKKENEILVNARIVLPKDLMMDESDSPISSVSRIRGGETPPGGTINPVGTPTPGLYPTNSMQKVLNISNAKSRLTQYDNLKKNLELLEKKYRKEYQASYQQSEEEYQQEIKPIIDTYNQQVQEALNRYCDIKDPGQVYNPEDPCQRPENIPYPELPKFNFEFRDELDARFLLNELKPENIDPLLEILEYDFENGNFDFEKSEYNIGILNSLFSGRTGFDDIYELISSSKDLATTIIAENTEIETETYARMGGVIIPVAKSGNALPFSYQLCPTSTNRFSNFSLALNMPDSSWDVVGMKCINKEDHSQYGNGIIESVHTYFTKTKNGNTIFLSNILASATTTGVMLLNVPRVFEFIITYSNGQTTYFIESNVDHKTCSSGYFETMGEVETPTLPNDDENFIPSGFGFKQLGIADYLKVEQSTHAYVEGEVAHIENVMAREYREKSTRRLRRSENTTTTSKDTEQEKLTDTTTATRFEMQSEVAKMQQEAKDFGAFANFQASWGSDANRYTIGAGANYASHSSKEESTRQAVTQSQDITARALDRIVTKVHEERIEKIIEEFEENNKHGFDNTKGDKHVVGVFRWVDKLMKNQIYNYGKRMMFEFMIPEPARLYRHGTKEMKNADLVKPVDPRTSETLKMSNYASLKDDVVLKHWISKYNVDVDIMDKEVINISKSFSDRDPGFGGKDDDKIQIINGSGEIEIPENYIAIEAKYLFYTSPHSFNGVHQASVSIAGKSSNWIVSAASTQAEGIITGLNVKGKVGYSFATRESPIMQGTFDIKCQLTLEAKNAWLQKTFNAIISAYEDALAEYNSKIAEEKANGIEIKGSNPNFYRQIENTILRKNCISYMSDRTSGSTRGYGLSGITEGNSFTTYETVLNNTLDKYTAFVKFMEQAFEWENISYYLYPYYWANKSNWLELNHSDDNDPLFRAFLQSGMARVVVTVRPGFENAVQFFMATGKIWNGGEVPVIGDELYLSIVDEMKEPKGEKLGKAWITKLPTPLTILQADSIGLKVSKALPFTTENPDDFENPDEVILTTNFEVKPGVLMTATDSKKQVDNIAIMDDKLVLMSGSDIISSLKMSELVKAELQPNNIEVDDENLLLLCNDNVIDKIPLERIKAKMGF